MENLGVIASCDREAHLKSRITRYEDGFRITADASTVTDLGMGDKFVKELLHGLRLGREWPLNLTLL